MSKSGVVKAKVALFKGGLILVAALAVLGQIIHKLVVPSVPLFGVMGTFSIVALVANSHCLFLLWRHRRDDLNMSFVWECSRNDIVANLAVVAAVGGIWATGAAWPDIVVALGLVCFLLRSALPVLSSASAELRSENLSSVLWLKNSLTG